MTTIRDLVAPVLAPGTEAAQEPWQVAMARLRGLSSMATQDEVSRALEPIGVSTTLTPPEASRVLALLDASKLKTKVLPKAKFPQGHPSNPVYYDAQKIVHAVHEAHGERRAAGSERASRAKAIRGLSDIDRRQIESARASEGAAVEKARAVEKLAKSGAMPTWSARAERRAANIARAYRVELEDRLLRTRSR